MANFQLNKPNYGLKDPSMLSMFSKTDNSMDTQSFSDITVEKLRHFNNHPFKLYEGQRFSDMVQSIKENGLFNPLIVRPVSDEDEHYEILSGHNRFEACRIAGFTTVACIVKTDLTDEDAYLIVTESNLIQRSFGDLSHSERALTLATHYETLKKQGKRSDLITEVENMILSADKACNDSENTIYSQVANKSNNMNKTGEQYGLSKDTVARYLRINKLIDLFKELLDNSELSLVAGVSLSYLTPDEQMQVMDYVDDNEAKVDIKKAELLKELSLQKKFTTAKMTEIFLGKKAVATTKKQVAFKVKIKTYSNYLKNIDTQKDFDDHLETIFKFYERYKDEHFHEQFNEE